MSSHIVLCRQKRRRQVCCSFETLDLYSHLEIVFIICVVTKLGTKIYSAIGSLFTNFIVHAKADCLLRCRSSPSFLMFYIHKCVFGVIYINQILLIAIYTLIIKEGCKIVTMGCCHQTECYSTAYHKEQLKDVKWTL